MANPPLQAVAYVSEVRRPMSMGEIDRLLISSSAHNALAAITGVLLFDGARFFQYFEGPPAGVRQTYDRIKQSSRHDVIAEVYSGLIVERQFPGWQMACRKVLAGSIVELSAQRWSRTRIALVSAGKRPEPISQLLAFWEGALPSTSIQGWVWVLNCLVVGGKKSVRLAAREWAQPAPSSVQSADARLRRKIHIYHSAEGVLPEDLEGGFSGYWLVSDRLRRVMEWVDADAFVFADADYRLADGSKGPTVFLCDVVRTLDASDEEASELTIEISDEFEAGKYYDLTGDIRLAFRRDVLGSARVFSLSLHGGIFCDRAFKEAVETAGTVTSSKSNGLWFYDVVNCWFANTGSKEEAWSPADYRTLSKTTKTSNSRR